MSVPAIDPLATAPTNVDPRFRYGTRAIPENFPQATSRFYLPTQRDSRFWPLMYYYRADNECFDALVSRTPPVCKQNQDCRALLDQWCTDGQARTVQYWCQPNDVEGSSGTCQYEFDPF